MRILNSQLIREADAFTIEHEPIASIDLMERAVTRLYKEMKPLIDEDDSFDIYCGLGNNGGDGLVLARLLFNDKIDVQVFVVHFSDKKSEDFQTNLLRLKEETSVSVTEIKEEKDFSPKFTIAVDALFGTGLSKPIIGFTGKLIQRINKHYRQRVAIDIPSGLFGDKHSLLTDSNIIQADVTFTIQVPKKAFLFPENHSYVGEWFIVDIGLDKDFIAKADSKEELLEFSSIQMLLKSRSKFSHKGTYGHGLLMAGSYGKTGAAVLAAKAALRSGLGLLSCCVPKSAYTILQSSVPESMLEVDENETHLASLPDTSHYNAIAIGPGIGKNTDTAKTLKLLIQNASEGLILDADALNILSENKTWLSFLPKGSILTPHPKEFERLVGKSQNDFERHEKLLAFAVKHHVYVILKGAYSCIATPNGYSYFNSSGNPGMASGGSGDVLTGILLGLKAQGYSSLETALIGCFIHGFAADIATEFIAEESLIASDIVSYLSDAFMQLK
jgi:ADP-dependent NAD(P)H-hydrate dehydratase / NAD(P)H-hydrate epimerase